MFFFLWMGWRNTCLRRMQISTTVLKCDELNYACSQYVPVLFFFLLLLFYRVLSVIY